MRYGLNHLGLNSVSKTADGVEIIGNQFNLLGRIDRIVNLAISVFL